MSTDQTTDHALRANSVGVAGIVFFVIAAAAPLAVVVGVSPIVFAQGIGAPSAFLIAAIVLLLFAVGYTRMSTFMSGPGGFAMYIREAFGKRPGVSASAVALVAYNGFQLGLIGQFGFLAQPLVAGDFGLDLPWWFWSLLAIAVIGVLGYRDLDLSAKVLGVLLIAEVLIVLAMNVGVVKSGGAQGLNLEGFMPSNLFTGAAGVTVLFAFASYVGFEATTIYGEEAKERKKTVPRATYIAVIFIGLFYSVTFWAIGVGYGNSNVTQAATDNPAGLVFDLTRHVVGPAASDIMNWLVMTSVFATVLSFHNTLSRYMFAMGRDGALPQRLGRAHGKHRSPHSGSMVQTAIAAVVVIAFAVAHADPYLQLYAWFIGFGTVGILVLYAAGALSVVWFFRRHPGQANAWVRIISPLLALVGLVFATYLSIANFSVLTGSTSTFINLLWLVIPIAAVIGYFAPPAHAGAVPDVHAPTPILDAE